MIGTHNSLSYLKPLHWWFRPFSFLWRCQELTLDEQINNGVNFFDIRVRLSKSKLILNLNESYDIRFCHGLVDFNPNNETFESVIRKIHSNGCKCRILIERISHNIDYDYFYVKRHIPPYIFESDTITEIIVKDGWIVKYNNDKYYQFKDYSYVPFHSDKSFWWNIAHMEWSTIKKWSKSHNPIITNEMITDDKVIHFLDFKERLIPKWLTK